MSERRQPQAGRRPRMAGISLVELLTTVLVLGLLAALAGPPLAQWLGDRRLIALNNLLAGDLQRARGEAARMRRAVVLCTRGPTLSCGGQATWETGWLVFEDPDGDRGCADANNDARCDGDNGRLLRVQPALPSGVTLRKTGTPADRMRFTDTGTAAFFNHRYTFCDRRGVTAARGLVVANTGRIRIAGPDDPLTCP
ncbi:MAG TPA: GspH/FimT family protein [Candidatus Acidoferrales bacterium]|nr:GspH/FimT family protein [Candidatus Acidoferrales bacterium]